MGSLHGNLCYLENYQAAQNTGDHFNFHAVLDEINADMLQFTNKWNWKWPV